MYIYIYIYIYYACIHVYTYNYMYINIYIYIYLCTLCGFGIRLVLHELLVGSAGHVRNYFATCSEGLGGIVRGPVRRHRTCDFPERRSSMFTEAVRLVPSVLICPVVICPYLRTSDDWRGPCDAAPARCCSTPGLNTAAAGF